MRRTSGSTYAKIFLSVFAAIIAAAAVIFGAKQFIAKWKSAAQHDLAKKAEEVNADFLHNSNRAADDPSFTNEGLGNLITHTEHAKEEEARRRSILLSSGVATAKELEACDYFQKETDTLLAKIKKRLAEQEAADLAKSEGQNEITQEPAPIAEESKKERKSRVAPEGVVYNLKPITLVSSKRPITIAPGADLKVVRKNEDGTVTLQYDDLVVLVPAEDVTNDRTTLWKHLDAALK